MDSTLVAILVGAVMIGAIVIYFRSLRPNLPIVDDPPDGYLRGLEYRYETKISPKKLDVHLPVDDGYAAFVDEMFKKPDVKLEGIVLKRLRGGEYTKCELLMLVKGHGGNLYINLLEEGRKLTLAADGRHMWLRDGEPIDNSAWIAIHRGGDADKLLSQEPYAGSPEEAISPAFNRTTARGRRFVIHYRNIDDKESWRLISRVIRQDDRFSAVCHVHPEKRSTFLNAGLIEVIDPDTGEDLSVPQFLTKSK